ncbi:MAG: hypothetical protein ACPGC5_00820 [Flavobacteriaceae bacterium]
MPKPQPILILTYYWPPSGGSGVQRWLYFAKYLKQKGWEPYVITVNPSHASYPVRDDTLVAEVSDIQLIQTPTREPLKWYARLSGSETSIPQGEVPRKSLFQKISAFIRGNFFVPDARKGWVPYAVAAVKKLLSEQKISYLITTGPPHSTHLAGLQLKREFDLEWWADFRDPWTDLFYNKSFYRQPFAIRKDLDLECQVLQQADGILTTVGGALHTQLQTKAPQQRFEAIPNGYDAELMHQTPAAPKPKEFHLVYTGLLTHNQAYNAVVNALKSFQTKNPIRWTFAGQIPQRILTEIQTELPEIQIDPRGYVSHSEAIALMKSADLLLNFSFQGAHQQMISGKLLEYLATSVPILSIGEPTSAAGVFLNQGSAAQMLAENDSAGISKFIQLALENQGQFHNQFPNLEDWSRSNLTKKLRDTLIRHPQGKK